MMSSRFSSNSGDSRYPPRDRSPPRFPAGRRESSSHGTSQSPRSSENNHRPGETHSSNSGPGRGLTREPPRGPKGHVDGHRPPSFASRGRGLAGRGDSRERELRDSRDSGFPRGDRDWPSRASPVSRDRSRSPSNRDFRPSRDSITSDPDTNRQRKDSRDGPLSAGASSLGNPISGGYFSRGAFRGRGRGDFESRGRGRGFSADDRDINTPRSRSRDRFRDRDYDRGWDRERDPFKRDDERKPVRDDGERDTDRSRREPLPRPESSNSTGAHTGPTIPHATSASLTTKISPLNTEAGKVQSVSAQATRVDQPIGEDQGARRSESLRHSVANTIPSSPPQAPQVPAFGSLPIQLGTSVPVSATGVSTGKQEASSSHIERTERTETPNAPRRLTPTAPKAQIIGQPPTGPRAADSRPQYGVNARIPTSSSQSPSFSRFSSDPRSGAPYPAALQPISTPARSFEQQATAQLSPESSRHASPKVQAFPETYNRSALPQPSNVPSGQTPPVKIPTGPKEMMRGQNALGGRGSGPSGPSIRAPMVGSGRGYPRPEDTSPPMRAPLAPSRAGIKQTGHPVHNMSWINPRLQAANPPRGPSIMNTLPPTAAHAVPAKRGFPGEDRPSISESNLSIPHASRTDDKQQSQRSSISNPSIRGVNVEFERDIQRSSVYSSHDKRNHSPSRSRESSANDVDTASAADQPSDDDDENTDLDEGDFEEAERRFQKELMVLEARRPATPRHDTDLILLLEELDALASAAEDLSNGIVPQATAISDIASGKVPQGLPSPKSERIDGVRRSMDPEVDSQHDSLPIDDLPYLITGPPTPFSDIDGLLENTKRHENIKTQILNRLSSQKQETSDETEDLKLEFARLYKPWRLEVDEFDNQKRAIEESALAQASPIPALSPMPTPAPVIESRRTGSKYATQLEIERVMEESRLAAEEAAERRANDAKALVMADLDREAVIPDMLRRYDTRGGIFTETNHLIDPELALEVLAFAQPRDTFSPEEHKLFTENYLTYPKKWGWIAQGIQNRDYQDCIQHYYLTKREANYKGQLSRRMGKRGRKVTRGPAARPKSNALMSDLGGRGQQSHSNDPDAPQVAVTDTGRPRRAAAPTFGDAANEVDQATPAPTPTRRAASSKGESAGDSTTERPTNRRTRTTIPKEKVGRGRGKAQLLAAAPGPSPQKKETESNRAKSKEPKVEDSQQAKELDEAQLLTGLQANQFGQRGPAQTTFAEGWSGGQQNITSPAAQVSGVQQLPAQNQQQTMAVETQQQTSRGQTSSYWSVPEQTDFFNLVCYYGTDWHSIANFLKTKTHIMVRSMLCCPYVSHSEY